MRFIYGDLDWVSGGQIKQFLKKIEDFVKAFTKLGVRPVFFFGGYGADFSSREGWFMRCRDKLNKVNTVFDKLANDTLTSELEPFLFVMPTNIGFSHYFRQIEGCEVSTSDFLHNFLDSATVPGARSGYQMFQL